MIVINHIEIKPGFKARFSEFRSDGVTKYFQSTFWCKHTLNWVLVLNPEGNMRKDIHNRLLTYLVLKNN